MTEEGSHSSPSQEQVSLNTILRFSVAAVRPVPQAKKLCGHVLVIGLQFTTPFNPNAVDLSRTSLAQELFLRRGIDLVIPAEAGIQVFLISPGPRPSPG